MFIDPNKTLVLIQRNIPHNLPKAYRHTLQLRSQLLSLIQDAESFSIPAQQESRLPECSSHGKNTGDFVTLVIDEALPSQKELTGAVEEYWKDMIHAAIKAAAQQEVLPHFEKAFVEIQITAPRGTDHSRVWDTSNRAIQVILNNLKGIFFLDDDSEHMAFSVVGRWGEGVGETLIRVWDFYKWEQIKAELLGAL